MLLDKNAGRGRYLVGFDLRDDACQISWMENPGRRPPKEPVTFSLVPDREQFDIPVALAKTKGANHWLCGPEAVKASADSSCTYLPKLVTLALDGRPVTIEDRPYEPTALLALFIKRCLDMIRDEVPSREILALMFTAREMDLKMIGVLENVRSRLELSCEIYYESYASSFYHFLLMQAETVREPASILFEYEKGGPLRIARMRYNLRTKPKVAFYEEKVLPGLFAENDADRDQEFLAIASGAIGKERYASCYLIGSGFDSGWMQRSIPYLCRGRRAFMGSNLFVKGAGYGAWIKACHPAVADAYYFLDKNKLQDNIGVRGQEKGSLQLHSILDAGVNWYEAAADCDVILEGSNEIHLTLTPLSGGSAEDFLIRLEGLPVREGRAARIRMHFSMSARDKVEVLLEDLGFGEIFPSTGLKWQQTITVK